MSNIARQLVISSYDAQSVKVLQSLASEPRISILNLLNNRNLMNISDVAKELDMPLSTTMLHIKKLEQAGLIHTELQPSSAGMQRVCNRVYTSILFNIPDIETLQKDRSIEIEMPIGSFSHCEATTTCGLVSEHDIIGMLDDPQSFYEPNHIHAQLLWFKKGYIEYIFPNRASPKTKIYAIAFSMEICSEAPMYHDDWPSDITMWINDVEIGTWTSPADFGGERGYLTPAWWSERHTQYGLLKEWKVTEQGSFIDGTLISDTKILHLNIDTSKAITMKLGIKDDAKHVGGLNLFGEKFGNYRQGIVLHIYYHNIK